MESRAPAIKMGSSEPTGLGMDEMWGEMESA